VISVRIGEHILKYPRSGLLSIIEGEQTEWNYWSFKASAGIVARNGNTDQNDFNIHSFVRREAGRTRIDLEYIGNFGAVEGKQTIDNHNTSGRFDWLITQGFFVTPVHMTFFSDRFQNIDLRSTFGAGVGYFITRTKDVEWSITFGGGYQSTTYTSVLPGEERTQGTGIIIPGTGLEMDITGALEMDAEYYAQIGLAEPQNTFHHSNLQFQLDVLGDILDFTLSFTWDHNTNPQADENGLVPEKSDFRTSFGIGVDI
jgi:putative salt-induced outer membrane protein YdiY